MKASRRAAMPALPRRHALSLAAAAPCGTLPWSQAWAQDSDPATPDKTVEAQVLDIVTVTATRRNASVQDIPINITAVTGADIARQGLTDLADLAQTVPGLFLVDQGGRDGNPIVVRGLNVSPLGAGEGTGNGSGDVVATYIGDIPLYLDLKLMDMDRVEVLLGPQGTLYGAGTLGGAIRYLPNRPSTAGKTISVSQDSYLLGHSSGLGSETVVTGNLPLGSRVAVRGSVGFFHGPGFIDQNLLVRTPGVSDPEPDFSDPAAVAANLRREKDSDSENTLAGRAAMLYRLSDSLTANLSYFYQLQRVGSRTVSHSDALDIGRYDSGSRFLEPNSRKNQLLSLELEWDAGFAKLTSATGVSKYDELGQRDQTDLLLDLSSAGGYGYEDFPAFAAFTREDGTEKRLSQELRLVSTDSGPLNWIIGGFYNRSKNDFVSQEFVPGLPGFFGIVRDDNLEYYSLNEQKFTESAVFGELGYEFTPAWQATIGARLYRFNDDQTQAVAFPLFDDTGGIDLSDAQTNKVKDHGSLFKLNTSYTFSPSLLGYFTVSEGFRIGGVNLLPLCPDPLPAEQFACVKPNEVLISPDTTTNYELGAHSEWLNGRLRLNGSLFYIDWKDVQVAGRTEIGAVPITVNGGAANTKGFEVSLQGNLSRNWSINASYTNTDAQLTKDARGIIRGGDAFAGDRLPGSPRNQANLLLSYNRKLDNGWLASASYGFRAVGDVLTTPAMRDNGEALPGYVVHKASATLRHRQWMARLYAENLFDRYVETGTRSDASFVRAIPDVDGDGDGQPGDADNGDGFKLRRYYHDVLEPLRVGLSLSYDFKL